MKIQNLTHTHLPHKISYGIIIFENQRGLVFENGQFIKVLEPGRHKFSRLRDTLKKVNRLIQVIDSLPFTIEINGQEILSKEGIPSKVTMSLEAKFEDIVLAAVRIRNFRERLAAEGQFALREAITSRDIGDILTKRMEISLELENKLKAKAKDLGLEVSSARIKDIALPGPIKEAYGAEFRARKEAAAKLEKARGESASLRNLANAAKMMEDNPNLFRLRLLETIGESMGNTYELNLGNPQDRV